MLAKAEQEAVMERDKTCRGNASQFYVAGELCRRGYSAMVTLGNTPMSMSFVATGRGRDLPTFRSRPFSPGARPVALG